MSIPLNVEKARLGEPNWGLTVVTAVIGWALANMDAAFFTYAYPYIQKEFGFGLQTVSYIYLMLFIVGWLATLAVGPVVDYWGRKVAFQLTMIFTAFGSLLTGFASGFGSLMLFRSISSAGSSAENFTSHVMVLESVPPKKKGMMVAIAQSGYPLGWFLATGLTYAFINVIGWRGMFFIGVVPALFVVYLRIFTKEPVRSAEAIKVRRSYKKGIEIDKSELTYQIDEGKAVHNTLKQLFDSDIRKTTILVSIWFAFICFAVAAGSLYAPTIATQRGLSDSDLQLIGFASNGLAVLGYLLNGYLGGLIGRKYASISFSVIGVIFGVLYAVAGYTPFTYTLFFILWQFFFFGQFGSNITYIMESFPTRVRGTGSNFIGQWVWLSFAIAAVLAPVLMGTLGTQGFLVLTIAIIPVIGIITFLFARNIPPDATLEDIMV
jgi:putative MFS transporter